MSNLGPIGFVGGFNSKASPFTIGKDQMSDGQDVQIYYGDLMKRNGSATINSSAISGTPAVHGLIDWLVASGTRFMVVTAGTKVQQCSALGSSLTDITGSATITAGQNNQHTFSSLNNILAICGGATPDAPVQWTGTGNVTTLAGSPPSGNLTAVANNFMFISGVAANPSRVYWSNASDPGTWGATNYVDFRVSDGDIVTAICEQRQNLCIFKKRSIGILFTQSNVVSGTVTLAPLTQIVVGMGCAGSQALDKLPDGRIVFMGTNQHMYIFNGAELEDISDTPYPQSNIQPTLDGLNSARLQYTVVRVYPTRNQVWISSSTGSNATNNAVYVYDYSLEVWNPPFSGINANVMTTSIDARSTPSHPIVMLTGDYGGFVYEQDKGSTNAEDPNGVINGYGTVSIQVGQDKTDFIPRSVIIPYEAQTTASNLEFDYGFNAYTDAPNQVFLSQIQSSYLLDSTFVLDTATLAGPATLRQVVAVNTDGRTFSMQLRFKNANASQGFTVHPVMISDQVLI